jgi:hypothetical protein
MEKDIKARKTFFGSAVFAVTFYLTAKILNYFIFGDLLYPVMFGFILAAEIGFLAADKKDWMEAHKKTYSFVLECVVIIKKGIKENYKEFIAILSFILPVVIYFISFRIYFSKSGLQILEYINVNIIAIPGGAIHYGIIRALSLAICFIISVHYLIVFIGMLMKFRFEPSKKIPSLSEKLFVIFLFVLLGPAFPLGVYLTSWLIFVVGFLCMIICQAIILLALITILRLSAFSQLVSVAIGGTLGAFCGYLMPGWSEWVIIPTIEVVLVSAIAGGLFGLIFHKIGKSRLIAFSWEEVLKIKYLKV